MWWLILVTIVIIVILSARKDYKKHVAGNITQFGGMQNKYHLLVGYLTSHFSAKIIKLTQDSIQIASNTVTFYIDYVGNNTEIRLYASLAILGRISKKWKYPNGYPQEIMIKEIEYYFDLEKERLITMINAGVANQYSEDGKGSTFRIISLQQFLRENNIGISLKAKAYSSTSERCFFLVQSNDLTPDYDMTGNIIGESKKRNTILAESSFSEGDMLDMKTAIVHISFINGKELPFICKSIDRIWLAMLSYLKPSKISR